MQNVVNIGEKMIFKPLNRHALLEFVEQKKDEEESRILVPDDYHVPKSPYGTYKILSVAGDCNSITPDDEGHTAVVKNTMVELINVYDKEYCLVLENYIFGIFSE